MDTEFAGEAGGSRAPVVISWIAAVAGIGLLVAGVVAVFVSSNTSGTAALLALGPILLVCAVFRDRVSTFKLGGVEVALAKKVKDSLRSAFNKRLTGNYEAAEAEIQQAFVHFTQELDHDQLTRYTISNGYHDEVLVKLKRIVEARFGGTTQTTSATSSFFPLVDVVLTMDGKRVRDALAERNLTLCPDLEAHLDQPGLLVGVTIRPGPDLNANLFAERLRTNVQNGALNATCFLLIQNCTDPRSGQQFQELARQLGMHATSVQWAAGGTEPELDEAIDKAILTICHKRLPITEPSLFAG